MKIADAIEDVDGGAKKPKGAKKKKKKGARKAKDADINMLNVQEVDQDESWESARSGAKHVDLSNAMPGMAAGDTPAATYGAMGMSSEKRSGQNMMPSIGQTPQGRSMQAHGLSQNASA